MPILSLLYRRTRTMSRRIRALPIWPRPILLLAMVLVFLHLRLYRWLDDQHLVVRNILAPPLDAAEGVDQSSSIPGSPTSLSTDDFRTSNSLLTSLFDWLQSTPTNTHALRNQIPRTSVRTNVFSFQGGFVTTPGDSLLEEERQKDARRFWVGLSRVTWWTKGIEAINAGFWLIGVLGLWRSSSRLLRILHFHTTTTLYMSIFLVFLSLILLTINPVRESVCDSLLASDAFQAQLDTWSKVLVSTEGGWTMDGSNGSGSGSGSGWGKPSLRRTSQGGARGEGVGWDDRTKRIAVAILENVLSDGDTCSYVLLSAGRTIVSALGMILLAISLALDRLIERNLSLLTGPRYPSPRLPIRVKVDYSLFHHPASSSSIMANPARTSCSDDDLARTLRAGEVTEMTLLT